jgi:hypothetical protein
MGLTTSTPQPSATTSTAQALSHLGAQVKVLGTLAGLVDTSLNLIILEGHGTATVSPPSDKKDYLVEFNLTSGSKARVFFNDEQNIYGGHKTTGGTGDMMYLPQQFVSLGDDAWEQGAAVISFGIRRNSHTSAEPTHSPQAAPTFFIDKATGWSLGNATASLLSYGTQGFTREVQGQLHRNQRDSEVLADLLKEVLPAIAALNTALSARLTA